MSYYLELLRLQQLQLQQTNFEAILHESTLPATKIKRKYKCPECEIITLNPREHLRHRKSIHGHKIKIVMCPFCVYACQYRQKLMRHLKLVHRHYPFETPSSSSKTCGDTTNKDEPLDLSLSDEAKRTIRQSKALQVD